MSVEGILSRIVMAVAATTVIYTSLGGALSDATAAFALFAAVIWLQEEAIEFVKEARNEHKKNESASYKRRESTEDATGHRENVR